MNEKVCFFSLVFGIGLMSVSFHIMPYFEVPGYVALGVGGLLIRWAITILFNEINKREDVVG